MNRFIQFTGLLIGLVILFSFINPLEKESGIYQPIPLKDVVLTGELAQRVCKNMDRLEEEKYHPNNVFLTKKQSGDWPGDTEGRTMLGLVLDAQTCKREPKYLEEIVRLYPEKMNNKGYFGDLYLDSNLISEQQLSSHGWVLRGLCEYYLWKKDPRALNMIDTILKNLAYPTIGYHKSYPIDPSQRTHTGGHSGSDAGVIGNWALSTDIGCDHIFLDGLTQAYQIRPSEKLKTLIDEMIGRFREIDQIKIKAQTHATLTAVRSILRYYEMNGDPSLLKLAEERFALYKNEGMTENYENYNWFGRPEWTEPCTVVDSYIAAVNLWKHTGKPDYLQEAHHIYYNGLSLEQRTNGGFGIQSCAGAKGPFIEATLQEAHWCCSMRGGEGLSRAAEYSFFTGKNDLVVPFYKSAIANFNFDGKVLKLEESTNYPFEGNAKISILESSVSKPISFKFFAPSWMENFKVKVNGKVQAFKKDSGFAVIKMIPKKGDKIDVTSSLAFKAKSTFNKNSIPGYHTFRYGPLILVRKGDMEEALPKETKFSKVNDYLYKSKDGAVEMVPLYHLLNNEVSVDAKFKRQILFKK